MLFHPGEPFLAGLPQNARLRAAAAAGPFQPPAGLPTKAHVARAIAEAQTQRMARISNGTLK